MPVLHCGWRRLRQWMHWCCSHDLADGTSTDCQQQLLPHPVVHVSVSTNPDHIPPVIESIVLPHRGRGGRRRPAAAGGVGSGGARGIRHPVQRRGPAGRRAATLLPHGRVPGQRRARLESVLRCICVRQVRGVPDRLGYCFGYRAVMSPVVLGSALLLRDGGCTACRQQASPRSSVQAQCRVLCLSKAFML